MAVFIVPRFLKAALGVGWRSSPESRSLKYVDLKNLWDVAKQAAAEVLVSVLSLGLRSRPRDGR
jgi:hypothetical protein